MKNEETLEKLRITNIISGFNPDTGKSVCVQLKKKKRRNKAEVEEALVTDMGSHRPRLKQPADVTELPQLHRCCTCLFIFLTAQWSCALPKTAVNETAHTHGSAGSCQHERFNLLWQCFHFTWSVVLSWCWGVHNDVNLQLQLFSHVDRLGLKIYPLVKVTSIWQKSRSVKLAALG